MASLRKIKDSSTLSGTFVVGPIATDDERSEQPSVMLRAMVTQLGPDTADRPLLVRYFSTAFCFTEGQGYKIFGWFPDGTGALQDAGIDALLSRRIEEARSEWDKPGEWRLEKGNIHLRRRRG